MNEPPFIVMLLGNVLFGGVLFSFMAVFFYYGPPALLEYLGKIKRCRHRVKGTVTDVKHVYNKFFDHDNISPNPDTRKAWEPAICYTYNDVDYKATSSVVTSWKRHQVGQEVEIYINEKHPEEYYLRGEMKTLIMGSILMTLVSVVFFALFAGFLWDKLA